MVEGPDWSDLFDAAEEFSEVSVERARQIVEAMIAQGRLARDRGEDLADEIVRRSRLPAQRFSDAVPAEVNRQLEPLRGAMREQLGEVEDRLTSRIEAATAVVRGARGGGRKSTTRT